LKFSRKTLVVLGAIVLSISVAVAAFAYWTSTGTGSGSATVGTAANSIVVTGTTSGLLYPGGPSRTVSFTAANPETSNQSISNIHMTGVDAYVEAGHTTLIPGCSTVGNSATTDFQMADVTVNPATDGNIAPGATAQVLTTTGSIHMNNLATNQDSCKSAFLVLHFTTS
jgi:hypothetical protein